MRHNNMILVGGWCMVLFAILFVGITLLIDNIVQTQPMLYDTAHHQLFKVMAGSGAIRGLLILYSIVPLLLIPAAVGAYYAFIETHEANMRVGMYFATVAAIGMSMSLMMLPSINWYLATYISGMSNPTDKADMVNLLMSFHSYFGVFVGDILGIGCVLVWFFINSFVIMRSFVLPRLLGVIELIIALIAALVLIFRYSNILPSLALYVQVNALIALWLFILGVALISLRRV